MITKNRNIDSGWIPEEFNEGWRYSYVAKKIDSEKKISDILSSNFTHSSKQSWEARIDNGQISINNKVVRNNQKIKSGDLINWSRPPWKEPSVPINWGIIYDDGDMLIVNKPAGLPVMPGGGFLKHTLLYLLSKSTNQIEGINSPKPIHRIGRHTSGLLICAREKATRSKLSKVMRIQSSSKNEFQKIYRGLTISNPHFYLNQRLEINIPIGKRYHPLLGSIWAIESQLDRGKLITTNNKNATTKVKILEKRPDEDLIEACILTGRPHQIRIHLSAIGANLIGDRLYQESGKVSFKETPGNGGYFLHAHKLLNLPIQNKIHSFEAPLPNRLKMKHEK